VHADILRGRCQSGASRVLFVAHMPVAAYALTPIMLQAVDEFESGAAQVYRRLVDIYNGRGWLSADGTVTTTTPFDDSGLLLPPLAHVSGVATLHLYQVYAVVWLSHTYTRHIYNSRTYTVVHTTDGTVAATTPFEDSGLLLPPLAHVSGVATMLFVQLLFINSSTLSNSCIFTAV
jgi:hypothetical protein